MSEISLTDEAISAGILERAKALHELLSEELRAGIDRLKAGNEDDAKARAETIRAHRKALQAVVEIEAQMMREAARKGELRAIDVEAAKREIYRRLDIEPAGAATA
ncbi:MAG: hypothetical protein AAFN79_18565 [Pseudomonadota bacterium]